MKIVALLSKLVLGLTLALSLTAGADSLTANVTSVRLESCGPSSVRSKCLKDWTVLVYMAVDTDMIPYAWLDLYEMEAGYESGKKLAGSTAKSDVLVELNSVDSPDAERRQIVQSTVSYSKSVYSRDLKSLDFAEIKSPVIERVKKTANFQSPATLAKNFEAFVRWGLEKYPARHTWVIYWGHGEGWQNTADASAKVVQVVNVMSRPEPLRLKAALENALGSTSSLPHARAHAPEKIDVFTADSCFMQMAEVLTELSPFARYVIGSSQVQSYAGLPYRRILAELNGSTFGGELRGGLSPTNDEAFALAKMIPTLMKQSISPGGLAYGLDRKARAGFSINSVSTDEMEHYLIPAMHGVSSALAQALKADASLRADLGTLLSQAPHYAGSAPDMGAFLDLLSEWAQHLNESQKQPVVLSIERAKSALHRSVVNFAVGSDYPAGVRGLSLWVPGVTSEYDHQIGDYLKSRFYTLTEFNRWLKLTFMR